MAMVSSTNNPSPCSPPPTSSTPSPSSKPPTPPPPPPTFSSSKSLQSALLAMQRTPAAWGLVVPLLAHTDPNVQFFGAHTAHAKIARDDLGGLPPQERLALRDALVGLAGVSPPRAITKKLHRCDIQKSGALACRQTYRPRLPCSILPMVFESLDVVCLLRCTDAQPLSVRPPCFPVLSPVIPPDPVKTRAVLTASRRTAATRARHSCGLVVVSLTAAAAAGLEEGRLCEDVEEAPRIRWGDVARALGTSVPPSSRRPLPSVRFTFTAFPLHLRSFKLFSSVPPSVFIPSPLRLCVVHTALDLDSASEDVADVSMPGAA
ncbi:hypothetical protein DFH06DRAFT_1330277 [Mycena polygramma]|nr:hypothetical protein DFH06DRAFT_1330277 [Mycena polygramma]